jgi:hypothetical protein
MNRELRHQLLDLALDAGERAEVEFSGDGNISFTVWSNRKGLSRKIIDSINSWDFDTTEEFIERVKQLLK